MRNYITATRCFELENRDTYIMFRGPFGLHCGPHINSELEIIISTHGKITVVLGENELCISENEAVLIRPYEPHSFKPQNDAEGRVYMFTLNVTKDVYTNFNANTVSSAKFSLSDEAVPYIKKLAHKAEARPDEFHARTLFFSLLNEYFESHIQLSNNNPNSLVISKISDYIHANIQDKITLKMLSAELGINSATLSKLLREYTGIPFSDFVNNLRIENAILLLHDCDISVTEAAFLSGFGSTRNFNRVFFSTLGITPTEYKKKRKNLS